MITPRTPVQTTCDHPPLLAATLIVRNEAATLPGCLDSLHGAVDEIVVYDTGSTDGTQQLARAAGARVVDGYWDDDFGRARNAALEMTSARWVLVIDADERLRGDVAGLRACLSQGPAAGTRSAGDVDLLLLTVHNVVESGPGDSLQAVRIARRSSVRWDGTVHEHLRVAGVPAGHEHRLTVPANVVHLVHHGYADPLVARGKSERNLVLAQRQLDRLVADGSTDRRAAARVLLDLGRSFLGTGRRQDAVDAFETLRELGDTGIFRAQATAMLTQLLLDEGGFDEVALVLEQELRDSAGANPDYCDWLRAQALARLGHRAAALQLLRGIDSLVDPVGTRLPTSLVLVARTVLAAAAGQTEEAGSALLAAMVEHGGAADRVELLAQLWAGRETELAERLRASQSPHAARVATALARLSRRARPIAPGLIRHRPRQQRVLERTSATG